MARHFADDDGRTVADMSELDRPRLFFPARKKQDAPPTGQDLRLNRDERRAMVRGAVSAGLLVAGAIAAGFALLILLIQLVWH